MKNTFLLIFIFLMLSSSVFGQSQIIFDKEDTQSFLMRYRQGESDIKKMIFTKIAKAYNKPVSNVSLTFSYKQRRQILRRGNKLEFIVKLRDITISGDKMYREFDVGETLIPGKTSFTLKWLRGNTVVNEFMFNDVSVSGNNVTIVNMTVNDSVQANNNKIRLTDKVFDYTQQNKQQFDRKVNLIDKYYNENLIARNKLRYLNNINSDRDYLIHLENLNDIYILRDTANNVTAYVNSVRQKSFFKSLPLNANDPKGLKNKLSNINNKAKALRDVCTDILENLDQIYYERGIEMLARHNPSKADYYFNKSLEVNPMFAPSHFQLARLYYNSGYIDKAVNKIFEIRGMNPDQETKMQTVELARGIYNDFLLDAGELNNTGRYDEAISILQRARDICRDFPEVICRSNMDVEMSRAVNGKYKIILNDIDINLSNKNLQEAERIIKAAIDFAENSRAFIPDNSQVAERISDLYFIYVERGDQLTLKRSFDKAVLEYNQASRICKNYREINCTDELNKGYFNARTGIYTLYINDAEQIFRSGKNYEAERKIEKAIAYRKKYNLKQDLSEDRLFLDIKQSIYAGFIEDGNSYNTSGNYKEALSKYDNAKQIEKSYSIRANINLRKYIEESANSLVLNITDEGKNKVKVNNLKIAKQLYNDAKALVTKYSLEDNIVNNAVSDLKGQIFKRECINAQNDYNNYYQEALDLIADRKYISADNKLNDALSYAVSYFQCEIDTKQAKNKKDYISSAVNYSKKVSAVNNNIKRKNYKSALEEYMSAETYHKAQAIRKFGISHTPLYDFISANNTDFIIYSAGFYNHNKEFEKAINLLKEVSRRQAKSKYSKDVQVALGTDLATYDFNQNPNGNYKSNIAKYAGGDKFLKYFSKAYKKQWKRLD
ncbi:MAG: hypothetical protein K8R54_14085 [Bacteroidales bacterium]|nr:hypothetical protein [Bacteroidales bacterium]